jgi:hypothetical protein
MGEYVLVSYTSGVVLLEAETGKVVWDSQAFGKRIRRLIGQPLVQGDLVVIPEEKRLLALKLTRATQKAAEEVPVHPLLRPWVRESLARWNRWSRDHPDQAALALRAVAPEDLKVLREDLKVVLEEIDAALKEDSATEPE